MGRGLINTRYYLPSPFTEGGLNLIAVVKGSFHPYNFGNVVIFTEKLYDLDLLKAELTVVWQVLYLTGSALFSVGASFKIGYRGLVLFQGVHLSGLLFIFGKNAL